MVTEEVATGERERVKERGREKQTDRLTGYLLAGKDEFIKSDHAIPVFIHFLWRATQNVRSGRVTQLFYLSPSE